MSVIWGEAKKRHRAHALSGIEVDEVSLVDRPATGKRFVLFKRRAPLVRLPEEDTNICSDEPEGAETLESRLLAVEALEKRADETLGELSRLQAVAARIEARLALLEAGQPARQSADAAAPPRHLWSGVL